MTDPQHATAHFDRFTFINHSGRVLTLDWFELLDREGEAHRFPVDAAVEPGEDLVTPCRGGDPVQPVYVSCAIRDPSGAALPPLHAGVSWPEWIYRAEFGYTLMAPGQVHPIRIVALGG